MRIVSITVRNYRVHKDLRVEIDAARTVIGGPNECGKSTLIEAAHRALFLKAKITGEGQKSMVSRHGSDHPEVEVEFETGGKTYRVAKRFSGASGTAQLSEVGGATWQGDEAETRLAELLRVEPVSGGRGAVERSAGQWAHLWVRQGQSGEDPTEAASEQSKALLANLQTGGAAAVMQSELDSRLARSFAEMRDGIFTSTDKPKAGSELAQAAKHLEDAAQDAAEARAEVNALHEAANRLRLAERTIREAEESLPDLKAQQKQNAESRAKARELEHRIDAEQVKADAADEKLNNLTTATRDIEEARQEISDAESALGPAREKEQSLVKAEKDASARLTEAKRIAGTATEAAQLARKREKLARAWVTVLERRQVKDALQKQWDDLAKLKGDLEAGRRELAALPPIDQKRFEHLQALSRADREARVALESMATGIEVLKASVNVAIGDEELPVGEQRIIAEETELSVGEAATVRIVPGGGSGLAAARERAKEAETDLADALAEVGVSTMDEAAAKHAERAEAEKKVDQIRTTIEARDPSDLEQRLGDAASRLQEAESTLEQRRRGVADFPEPDDLEAATALMDECEEALRSAEEQEQKRGEERTAAETALDRATGKLRSHRESIEDAAGTIRNLKATLEVLVKKHGEDEERAAALARLSGESKAASNALEASRKELASLNPEQLNLDRERLDRAISKATAERTKAGEEAAVAKATLHRDGSTDPEAALALAEAAETSARDRHTRVRRHADAIRRLADLFSEEQRSLAEEFTRPLAKKVSGYLQCIFGRDSRATLTLSDQSFETLRLTRPNGTFDFADLSGGAREQVAAAFRLATAEILAEDFDGCLPLVFDDAFTNSDPDRVQALQRMLDLAANRGLQIIVLTCNPADYSGLGAETVTIGAPALPAAVAEQA